MSFVFWFQQEKVQALKKEMSHHDHDLWFNSLTLSYPLLAAQYLKSFPYFSAYICLSCVAKV